MNFFFFLMLARGEQALPPTCIIPFVFFFFGSFLSRRLKVKCIFLLRNYKCVKRIALPSPKQHAFLIPALFSSSLFLSLFFPCFSSFTGDTHVGTAHFQTQMDLFRPQPFTFLSHHLENVFNRNLIFLVYSRLSS